MQERRRDRLGKERYTVCSLEKKDRDIRVSDAEYKKLVNGMSKKERREFDRKQEQLRRDREDDRLMAWLEFEDEMDEDDL